MNDDDEELKAVLGQLPAVKSRSYLASAAYLVLGLIACWIAFGTELWIWSRIVAGIFGLIWLVAGLLGIRRAGRPSRPSGQ
jgi:hypothetical protein